MNRRTYPFFLVDVFASEAFEGNPLALVAEADDLSDAAMRSVAREVNQAETTFLLRPTRQGPDWRLRSFTPSGDEIFGAGHNALGAWWWLAAAGHLDVISKKHFHQEIGNHILPVEFIVKGGQVDSVAMTQTPPTFGRRVDDLRPLALALGLSEADLSKSPLPPQVLSTGSSHLMVQLFDPDIVDSAAPDPDTLRDILNSVEARGCYVFCSGARHLAANVYTRFFDPADGLWEDPGTGSAAGSLAMLLFANGWLSAEKTLVVEQGTALGRTSLIAVRPKPSGPQIFGRGLIVAEGVLQL